MTRLALPLLLFAAPIFAQTKPAAPLPEVEQAFEALKANKVPEALDKLAQAAKINRQLPPPKVQLAQWLFQLGNGPAARTFIEQALAEDPKHPEGYLLNANSPLVRGG